MIMTGVSMNTKKFLIAGLVFPLLLASCALPQGLLPPTPGLPLPTTTPETAQPSATATPLATQTPLPATSTVTAASPTATITPTDTLTPSPTLSPTPITFPTVVFKTNANCRLGPSTNYNQVTNFLTNRSTTAEGRNRDSSWLWVKTSSTNCWINTATLKDPIDFTFLPVIPFTPLPEAPSRLTVVQLECSGRTSITLRWADVTGETGYTLYRNGIQLTKLRADLTEYVDFPPLATEYLYEIESYNDVGVSVRYGQRVQGCKK
jgi:hypothetical protein